MKAMTAIVLLAFAAVIALFVAAILLRAGWRRWRVRTAKWKYQEKPRDGRLHFYAVKYGQKPMEIRQPLDFDDPDFGIQRGVARNEAKERVYDLNAH